MRNEDHGPIATSQSADDLEHSLGEVGRQGGRHLVEHEHVGLDREGAREVDNPERGEGQMPRLARQVEVVEAQLVDPVTERLEWRFRETQIRPDVEVRDERRLLVDGDDAAAPRVTWRVDRSILASDD